MGFHFVLVWGLEKVKVRSGSLLNSLFGQGFWMVMFFLQQWRSRWRLRGRRCSRGMADPQIYIFSGGTIKVGERRGPCAMELYLLRQPYYSDDCTFHMPLSLS